MTTVSPATPAPVEVQNVPPDEERAELERLESVIEVLP